MAMEWRNGPFGSKYINYVIDVVNERYSLGFWDDQPQKKIAIVLRKREGEKWVTKRRCCWSWKSGTLKRYDMVYEGQKHLMRKDLYEVLPYEVQSFAKMIITSAVVKKTAHHSEEMMQNITEVWMDELFFSKVQPYLAHPELSWTTNSWLSRTGASSELVTLFAVNKLRPGNGALQTALTREDIESLTGGTGPALYKAAMEGLIKGHKGRFHTGQLQYAKLFDSNDWKQRVVRCPMPREILTEAEISLLRAYPEERRLRLLRSGVGQLGDTRYMVTEMKEAEGYELPKKVNTIRQLHDAVNTDYRRYQRRQKAETYAAPLPIKEGWEGIDGLQVEDLTFALPKVGMDLVEWGDKLHHCVGSYINSVECGHCIILGVMQKGVPIYTIEVREGEIRQFYGMRNSTPLPHHSEVIRCALAPYLAVEERPIQRGLQELERFNPDAPFRDD